MGAHMPAIGQQGHGVELPTGEYFDHHHGHRQCHDPGYFAFTAQHGAMKRLSLDTGQCCSLWRHGSRSM